MSTFDVLANHFKKIHKKYAYASCIKGVALFQFCFQTVTTAGEVRHLYIFVEKEIVLKIVSLVDIASLYPC